ncbi:glycosyl hydrolase family protein [Mesorhizobium sp. B2-4-12]|uniref:family 16 glycosylhydrolase n=1 Tax=Mesorhizobium sp. B2-4-12 TaxID=2589937 RepID=UPI00112EEFA9|nr:family 16 glycosylhydrolase [Mesorhizobium sp. B2-4-12]TPK99782.1 glycosyl hydrolase family protein [Mesorhizobium sp. B2-4-12]
MNSTRRQFLTLLTASTAMQWVAGHALAESGTAGSGNVTLDKLPDWSSVRLQLWKYSNPFVPSQWSEPKLGGYDWKAANVKIVDGSLQLTVSEKASAQVVSGANSASSSAKWEVDVTLPSMKPGLIAAPLWIFNDKAHEEVDFEIVGTKGMQLTVWANVDNQHKTVWMKLIQSGDLSGKRYRLAMQYEAGKRVAFFIDGKEVAVVTPADTPGGAFPNKPMQPYFDLWVAAGAVMDPRWAGKWEPMAPSERLVMTLHGYRRSDVGQ